MFVVPPSPRPHSNGLDSDSRREPDDTAPSAPACPPAPSEPPLVAPALGDGSYFPPLAPNPRHRYLDWASLLRRVYGEDILTCPKCGSQREIIAFIENPEVARKILEHLALPTAAPPRAPARRPAQSDLFD